MGRLTFCEDGRACVIGKNLKSASKNLYACVKKLQDYEDTGLSPEDVERLLDKSDARSSSVRGQIIKQIIPAHDIIALFGRREISDSSGSIKKQITEKIPVICWALVDDSESFVMGMVAQESGEIILVNQREDFLEYEVADGASKEDIKQAMDEKCRQRTALDVLNDIENKHRSQVMLLKRLYLRILSAETSVSRKKRLQILENLFDKNAENDGDLFSAHMEAIGSARAYEKHMRGQ